MAEGDMMDGKLISVFLLTVLDNRLRVEADRRGIEQNELICLLLDDGLRRVEGVRK